MAIVSHKLLKTGADGTAEGEAADSVTRTFSVMYQLASDDENDGNNTALNYCEATLGVPWIGDPYQFGNDQQASAVCKRIRPNRSPNGAYFNVTFEYEEPGGGGGGSEPEAVSIDLTRKPPLFWHDKIEVGTTYITIPVYAAKFRGYFKGDGSANPAIVNPWLNTSTGYHGPIVNSALDAYDPPPDGEIPIDILRITRNVWPWNDATAKAYRSTVNDGPVTISKPDYGYEKIIDAFTGRIIDITGSFEVDLEYKVRYWVQTIEVHVNPLGWRLTMIDKGLRRRAKSGDETDTGVTLDSSSVSTTGPHLTHIKDAAGNPITTPVLFDGNGKPLIAGFNPVLMKWEWHTERSWEGIPW